MLDSTGQTTDWPFPGGSVRWTNIANVSGWPIDLYVTEVANSARTYERPSQGVAASKANGFACIGLGIQPETCTNGGTLTIGSDGRSGCQGADSELVESGTPCSPLA